MVSLMMVNWRSDMTKKKLKRIEKDISMMKHSLELIKNSSSSASSNNASSDSNTGDIMTEYKRE